MAQATKRETQRNEILRAPAPWSLSGCGYIVAARFAEAFLEHGSFLPASLAGRRRGRMGLLMFVDYTDTPVGPYQELLFIPGNCQFADRRWHWTISRIFVSTEASVLNGRANWGIPKERADFDIRYDTSGQGCDELSVSRRGKAFARLAFRPRGFALPVTTAILPGFTHTLGQHWNGRTYVYTPEASGRMAPANLVECEVDAAVFPDIAQGSILACLQIPQFRMVFPEAQLIERI